MKQQLVVEALDLEYFMREALEQARNAGQRGDIPIGAVLVMDGRIIAQGCSTSQTQGNQLLHAEINALMNAAQPLWTAGPRWALRDNAVLFTTLEPCPMCLGATVMVDIPHIVFVAFHKNVFSSLSVEQNPCIRRHIQTYLGGVLENESRALIAEFMPQMLTTLDGF